MKQPSVNWKYRIYWPHRHCTLQILCLTGFYFHRAVKCFQNLCVIGLPQIIQRTQRQPCSNSSYRPTNFNQWRTWCGSLYPAGGYLCPDLQSTGDTWDIPSTFLPHIVARFEPPLEAYIYIYIYILYIYIIYIYIYIYI